MGPPRGALLGLTLLALAVGWAGPVAPPVTLVPPAWAAGEPAGASEEGPRLPPAPTWKTDPIKILRGQASEETAPVPQGPGLATRYPHDAGIGRDPEVVFATGFEADNWLDEWSYVDPEPRTYRTIETAPGLGFEPLLGRALQVVIPEGTRMGLNLHYKFAEEIGQEPEEIYFRYYLRFGRDWQPTVQGGKLPGIAGTYGEAGWGGRQADGQNGWSMRGMFDTLVGQGPAAGLIPVGTYAYHARMRDRYGDHWLWTSGDRGFLGRERWYCIEQRVKLNGLDWSDGILQVWIDGEIALEQRTVRYRDIDRLKIDRIWMNVYHGGTAFSPQDMHLFMDNVVVARRYIGPMTR